MDENLRLLLQKEKEDSLLSYFAGLHTISQLFDQGNAKQIRLLIRVLEQKKALFSDAELAIVDSGRNSREYLISCADSLIAEGAFEEAIGVLEVCLGEFNEAAVQDEFDKVYEKEKLKAETNGEEALDDAKMSKPLNAEDKERQNLNENLKKLSEISDDDLRARREECKRKGKGVVTSDEINDVIKAIMEEDKDLDVAFPELPTATPVQKEEPPIEDENDHTVFNEFENTTQNKSEISKDLSKTHRHRDFTKDDINKFLTNDQIIETAQKQAKLGLSALNFEDVTTAVESLRLAIQALEKYQSIEP